jgi:hypothetical protein
MIENSKIEKLNTKTANLEITTSSMTLKNANISAKPNSEDEKLLQEFYLLLKEKNWKEFYNFLLYNQEELILSKYFKEIQHASHTEQFNLNTRNNNYNIKIQEKMQIKDRRNQNKTLKIDENGFDIIWENLVDIERINKR